LEQNAVVDLQAQASEIASQLPEGIQVLQVYPGFIHVSSVEKASAKVPLQLKYAVGSGWHVNQDSIILQPDSIVVTGPIHDITGISFWETELVQLKDSSGFQHGTVALKAPHQLELSAIVVQYKLLLEPNLADTLSTEL
jgi:hypothetical protein